MLKKMAQILAGQGGRIVPGIARAIPVAGDTLLPESADVVVIGGGFIGCMTALTLAERGVSVALCEKGVVAGEASGRSVGWIDSQFLAPAKMELIGRSKALWSDMNARVGGETGYRRSGVVSLFADDAARDFAASWLASVHGMPGVDARLVDANEVAALVPGASHAFEGGLYQPSDASVEPRLAAPAMATAARRHGATILQNCAVRGLETSGGRVSGVVTERGAIACQSVVLAGGYWSPLFARSLGIPLPQFHANASLLSLRPQFAPSPETSAWGPGYVWRRQIDDCYTVGAINGAVPITPQTLRHAFRLLPAIRAMWNEVDPVLSPSAFLADLRTPRTWRLDAVSPFERNRILMPEIRHGFLDAAKAKMVGDFPVFEGAEEVERWAGTLVTTLDNMPVLSAAPQMPGLYLGTGFYYGLTMGPAAGEALADLVMGNTPQLDLKDYRYERFFDGSRLVFRS
jgi:glycine/D-amino acid oxidase-like deaminating enzyme